MKYTLKNLGAGILDELSNGADMCDIAKWSHNLYLNPDADTSDPEVQKEIMRLVAMEEGPEFEYSRDELENMARSFVGKSKGAS